MTKLYLGIDLGGTEVKLAIVDSHGKILEHDSIPNSYNATPDHVVSRIIAHSQAMKLFRKVSGTGVGVAGDIDQERGVVRFSPNMVKWVNVPLKMMLKESLPQPIVIDNDANAAAWGAYWLDAKGEATNLICITLGTGVGGGIICDEKLFRGSTGSAGEIGHITLDPKGPRCNCGNYGCIERYLGAKYISQEAIDAINRGEKSIIPKLVNGKLKDITPYILDIAANRGDALAMRIWHTAGERLGVIIASLINLINPQMIVLSGGVSKAGDLLLKPIHKTVKNRAFKKPAQACKIVISKYTQKLGVVGSAFLAR